MYLPETSATTLVQLFIIRINWRKKGRTAPELFHNVCRPARRLQQQRSCSRGRCLCLDSAGIYEMLDALTVVHCHWCSILHKLLVALKK
jgi:hypothetical protein